MLLGVHASDARRSFQRSDRRSVPQKTPAGTESTNVTLVTDSVTRLSRRIRQAARHRQKVGRAAGVSRAASVIAPRPWAWPTRSGQSRKTCGIAASATTWPKAELCAICQDPQARRGPAMRGRAATRLDGFGASGQLPRVVPRAAGPDCAAGGRRARSVDDRCPGRAGADRRASAK